MGLTYEWKVTQIKKTTNDSVENAIVGTRWEVKGTDTSGNDGLFVGATPFTLNQIDPENFIPYSELTEEIVLNWIKGYVSGSNPVTNYWDHISDRINKQIEEKTSTIDNVESVHLPWAPTSGSLTDASGSVIV
jgi:hypothetical protein